MNKERKSTIEGNVARAFNTVNNNINDVKKAYSQIQSFLEGSGLIDNPQEAVKAVSRALEAISDDAEACKSIASTISIYNKAFNNFQTIAGNVQAFLNTMEAPLTDLVVDATEDFDAIQEYADPLINEIEPGFQKIENHFKWAFLKTRIGSFFGFNSHATSTTSAS